MVGIPRWWTNLFDSKHEGRCCSRTSALAFEMNELLFSVCCAPSTRGIWHAVLLTNIQEPSYRMHSFDSSPFTSIDTSSCLHLFPVCHPRSHHGFVTYPCPSSIGQLSLSWLDRVSDSSGSRPRRAMALLARWDARARLGMALVLTVATMWVAASFFVQSIEEKGIPPLLLTYIANSLFMLYLPMHWLVRRWKGDAKERNAREDLVLEGMMNQEQKTISYRGMEMGNPLQAAAKKSAEVTEREIARAALKISPLWFIAEWTFNASLMSTSIGSNTILSSSSNMFTFLLAVLLIGEAFTVTKLASISTVIVGIIAVSVADSGPTRADGGNSMVGDALCLLSALCYGLFTVVLRKELGNDERVSMTFFFGCVGLFNLTFFLPVVLVYSLYHPEFFYITSSDFGLCLIKGLFDNVLSDYLWARAVLLLGPTLATVGLSLEVPMAIVAEFVVGHAPWAGHFGRTVLTFLGGALVLGGFFGLQREELVDEAYL
eukprot:scaffold227_cov394-Pavlova_lutheri.AAC.2